MAETIPASVPRTGMARIWARFRKAHGARVGLSLVAAFTLVAFLAPFIAHRLPFIWQDSATGAVSYPLIREFFAPSDTSEGMLERGINFLFLFIPLALALWRLTAKFLPGLAGTESRLISLLFGFLAAAVLWLAIGGMIVDGGGKDWLHAESAPLPEMDDILRPELLAGETAVAAGASVDEKRRGVLDYVQGLVLGPEQAVPQDQQDSFRRAGLVPGRINGDLDRARWNRLALELRLPGLLVPMRQLRSAFLSILAVSVLTLIGLTYICLAGAWQFSLSPRWLVLLVLAALLALAFRLPSRQDHTPYRELHAAGDGRGLFPPIPYGPNEQGFGPRLPPTWHAESPLYAAEAILNTDRVAAALPELATDGTREALAAALNTIIRTPLTDAAAYPRQLAERFGLTPASDRDLRPYAEAAVTERGLSALEVMRFTRIALDKRLSGSVQPASASRWKRPTHRPGYHVMGTDESGRDVLVRVIHGARVSLSVGFVSVFLATVLGLVLGALAAYYGGKVDMLISRFMEIMMCFPSFFLILAVIAVLDRQSIVNIMLVIGLTSWTGVARLIRGEMLRQKKMDYVQASIALGAPDTRTIFRHILPNAMAPVLVSISFGITGAILTEAGLSFIGFGVTPPTPTWGQLLSETRESPLANWWLVVFPGVVLFLSVLAYNFVGEALRDALDPRTTV